METTGKPNVIKCPFVWSCCSLFSGFILAQLALCFLDLFTLNQAPLSLFLSSLACPEVQVSFKDTPSPQPFQAKAVFPVPTLVPQPWRWGSCPWFFLLLPNTVKPPITEFSANTRFYTYHLHIFLALGVYSFFSKTVSLELTVFSHNSYSCQNLWCLNIPETVHPVLGLTLPWSHFLCSWPHSHPLSHLPQLLCFSSNNSQKLNLPQNALNTTLTFLIQSFHLWWNCLTFTQSIISSTACLLSSSSLAFLINTPLDTLSAPLPLQMFIIFTWLDTVLQPLL